eukprot:g2491.t1
MCQCITSLANNVVISTSGTVDVSGAFTLTGDAQIGDGANDTLDIQSTITSTSLTFEGATADAHETSLAITDPTADRTITLPDATGTVLLSSTTNTIASLASNVVISTSGTVFVSGTTTLTGNAQIGDALTDTLDIQSTITSTSLVFEGSTADTNELTLAVTDPTDDRTITLPDATGTVLLSSTTNTISSLAKCCDINEWIDATKNKGRYMSYEERSGTPYGIPLNRTDVEETLSDYDSDDEPTTSGDEASRMIMNIPFQETPIKFNPSKSRYM